jgi:hypothetical protein
MNSSSLAITVLVLLPFCIAPVQADPSEGALPFPIELRDQHDLPRRLAFPRTNITVLTIADRKGAEQVDGWIDALKARYSDRISLYGIADVRGAPSFLRGTIRRKFQAARPHPIMLDWSGEVCARLKYERDVANLLVFDRNGAILGRFAGRASGTNLARVCAVLDQTLAGRAELKRESDPAPHQGMLRSPFMADPVPSVRPRTPATPGPSAP